MKRNWLKIGSVLFFALLIWGCDDLLDISFTSNSTQFSFVVNPVAAGPYESTQDVVESDLSTQISDNGGNIGNLKSVELLECTVSVVSADRNLNSFQSIAVYAKAAGIDEKKIAWCDSVPANATSVPLYVSGDDIKNLIDQDQYTVTVKGVMAEGLETAIDLQAVAKYTVTVGPK